MAALVAASVVVREYRLKWAEEERDWRERELKRLEREEAERAEAKRFQELLEQINRWRQANEIRAFVEVVRGAAEGSAPRIGQERVGEWARWALRSAAPSP